METEMEGEINGGGGGGEREREIHSVKEDALSMGQYYYWLFSFLTQPERV